MIIARLRIHEHDGCRALVGKLTSNFPLPVGTGVVLIKRGDEYELVELGPRSVRFDRQSVKSFCLEGDEPKGAAQ